MIRVLIVFTVTASIILSSCKQELKCEKLVLDYSSLLDHLKTKSDTLSFVDQLKELNNREPDCIRAYHLMGWFEIRAGNYDTAELIFLKSLKYDSMSVYSLYNLAFLYNINNNNIMAFKYAEAALKSKFSDGPAKDYTNLFSKDFDIEYSELLFLRGVIFFDLKKYANAKKDFLIVEKRGYSLGETYPYLVNTYYYLNNIDSSCYYLEKYKSASTSIEGIIIDKNVQSICEGNRISPK